MIVAAVTAYVAMRRLTRNIGPAIVGLGALAALVLPAGALAKRTTVAPPGNSGISQYLEVVPTAAGPSPPSVGGGPVGGGQGGVLTDLQRHRLDGSGPNGRTLVTVVDATAPQQPGAAPANRSAAATGRSGAPGEGASPAPADPGASAGVDRIARLADPRRSRWQRGRWVGRLPAGLHARQRARACRRLRRTASAAAPVKT